MHLIKRAVPVEEAGELDRALVRHELDGVVKLVRLRPHDLHYVVRWDDQDGVAEQGLQYLWGLITFELK